MPRQIFETAESFSQKDVLPIAIMIGIVILILIIISQVPSSEVMQPSTVLLPFGFVCVILLIAAFSFSQERKADAQGHE